MLTIVSQIVLTAMDKRSKQRADCRRSQTSDRASDATSAKMLAKILERSERSEFGRNCEQHCTQCMRRYLSCRGWSISVCNSCHRFTS